MQDKVQSISHSTEEDDYAAIVSKRNFVLVVALSLTFAAMAFADEKLPVFKVGDTIYVCACGAGCDCQTMSRNDGKCACDKEMKKI